MNPRAPDASDHRSTRTLVLITAAFLVLAPTFGLISPRSRATAAPTSENRFTPEHEPPPSPLVAPPPPSTDAPASADASTGRDTVWKAVDAEPEPNAVGPASLNHAPDLAALEIRVTDTGRVVSGATVELVLDSAESSAPVLHSSDAHGLVRLELAPGSVRAVAWNAEACALPVSGTLTACALTRLELALEPAFPVAGRVLDARTGAPIAGAEVALWTYAERDTVTTGADGTFRHPRFPARAPAQQLAARAAGYGVAVRYLRIGPDGGWKISAHSANEESLAGTGTPWVELALVPELVVRGRVLDERGQALAGARVSAEGFFHALASVATRDHVEGRSDATGRFELAGLRSDIGHSLLVEAPGRAGLLRELESGATRLEAGELVLTRETVLAGAVVDPDGQPMADVEVVLHLDAPFGVDDLRAPPAPGSLDVGARIQGRERRARTDATGTFVFENLAALPVVLSVEHGAGLAARLELEPRADGSFDPPCLTLAPLAFATRAR